MDSMRELLGRRIKELRKTKNMSQDQLAEKVDIDPKHLSRIEVGRSYPSLDTLESIAVVLGAEVKDFFEFMHVSKGTNLREEIAELLQEAPEEKQRMILKIVRAILK